MLKATVAALLVFLWPTIAFAGEAPMPHWIWVDAKAPRSRRAIMRRTFDVAAEIKSAELVGVADFCQLALSLNDTPIAEIEDFSPRFKFDVTEQLKKGKNLLRARATSAGGPAAVALRLRLTFKNGSEQFVFTDKNWQATRDPSGKWTAAADLGALAPEPWGDHPDTISVTALDDYTQWKQASSVEASADPSSFFVRPGFQIELLRSAGNDEGSWVSLEFDPKGRLIIAREDKGLLRFTFTGKDKKKIQVETINDTLKECRGLLYAHGALYANANESGGLYRLRDTGNDDRFDEVKLLLRTDGGRGHGRNDLALGPDGRIYAIHGDAVEVPPEARNLRSPLRKHSRKGRRGFLLRIDRDGNNPEIVSTGLRNPFGIDFNADGEAFTYDADAEYDMGSPWYRPTRVHHLLPGGDYGWRAVTRAWPPYDPDKPDAAPPSLDIGKGSPTAVKFGTRSRFSPKYRRALFVLDWAYGRILAVHLTPRGASYAMRAETFLKGRPFNVTDLGFGPDGATYVVTGGRKTQSGLYRIKYVGEQQPEPKPTLQQTARAGHSMQMRKLRRLLEASFGKNDPSTLDAAWPHLNNPDPALRHAARIAVEHQPIAKWRARAFKEKRPLASLTALLSLAQANVPEDRPKIIQRSGELSIEKLPVSQQLTALRIYDLVLPTTQRRDPPLVQQCLKKLDPLYPSPHFAVNKPLSELLVGLKAPSFVPRTLSLLSQATAQEETFHYVYVLRHVRENWNLDRHDQYFRAMRRMRTFLGGEGMATFLSKIEADATSRLSRGERALISPLLKRAAHVIEIPEEARNRKIVQNWKAGDLVDSLEAVGKARSFERGRKMFHAATCSACHRVQATGNAIGPDLTSVAARFSRRDVLESIVNPDKVVAEQYRRDVIETKDGKVHTGMILPGGDYRSPELHVLPNPLDPTKVVKIAKKQVESHRKSPTSIMPAGLLSTLTKQEILDLLAYLESGGDAKHPIYQKQ